MAQETGGNTADGNTFDTSRRGFLGSSGLAAIGAVLGGVLPLSAQRHWHSAGPRAGRSGRRARGARARNI